MCLELSNLQPLGCLYFVQAHDICEELHNMNLSDLRGKTVAKVQTRLIIAMHHFVCLLCHVGQFVVGFSAATETHFVPAVIPRHYPVTFLNCNTHSGLSSGIAT